MFSQVPVCLQMLGQGKEVYTEYSPEPGTFCHQFDNMTGNTGLVDRDTIIMFLQIFEALNK